MLPRVLSFLSPLSLVLVACAATAAAQPMPTPSDEAVIAEPSPQQTAQSQPSAKSKLPAKSDINRIGQRGVGHGIDIYSLGKERAMGQSLATEIDRQTKLITDPEVVDYVNRLAQKLGRNSDSEFLITVKIIDTEDVNIFSLPGGFIYLDKGLILALESEAQLASLLSHEIGHIAARHATRALTREQAWSVVSLPLLYLGPAAFPVEALAIPLTRRKLDRDAEREADLLGLQYEYVAGYDPAAFIEALEKLHGIEVRRQRAYARIPLYKKAMRFPLRGQLSRAASRHPDMESRISALQKEIASLLPAAEQYIVDTNEFDEAQDRLNEANRPRFHHRGQPDDADKKKERPTLRDAMPLPLPNMTFVGARDEQNP